jgi:hypothetical protein
VVPRTWATSREAPTPGAALFLIKDDGDPGKNKIIWKWLRGQATDVPDLGDPVGGSTAYSLCVYDAAGGIPHLAASATVGAGTGWTAAGTAFKYADSSGAAAGIVKIILKPGADGEAKILMKGKGMGLVLPGGVNQTQYFAQDSAVTVQLLSSIGPCWEAVYTGPATKNDGAQFKDKLP